jgi:hypothetical protein
VYHLSCSPKSTKLENDVGRAKHARPSPHSQEIFPLACLTAETTAVEETGHRGAVPVFSPRVLSPFAITSVCNFIDGL